MSICCFHAEFDLIQSNDSLVSFFLPGQTVSDIRQILPFHTETECTERCINWLMFILYWVCSRLLQKLQFCFCCRFTSREGSMKEYNMFKHIIIGSLICNCLSVYVVSDEISSGNLFFLQLHRCVFSFWDTSWPENMLNSEIKIHL